ncbi:hypothetical protein SBA1_100102 [Candidatus Sulfotelmatobacter kueseliae]|uniref:Uncharacterized protein n=1 Tax=Candidatus Sulfotelmatobacter kueseliae TaxID=2042962 RepID=A0A2U3JWG3_9BACT|nr:hypothetical protein SBA1_100102 [Candidatus Sulfotelmatobacter kueseliae]
MWGQPPSAVRRARLDLLYGSQRNRQGNSTENNREGHEFTRADSTSENEPASAAEGPRLVHLGHACSSTDSAAPRFAVFEAWEPRTSIPGPFD